MIYDLYLWQLNQIIYLRMNKFLRMKKKIVSFDVDQGTGHKFIHTFDVSY